MKKMAIVFLLCYSAHSLFAQSIDKALKFSLQTDLIAYTTEGGWSIWAALQHHENKISLAYVNFPNRYAEYYEETGLKETDRFCRLQFARYMNPEKKLKNLYFGINFEYHLRELEEDNNTETLDESGFKIAPIVGYEWHPFGKKKNALNNLSLAIWAGPTYLIGYDEDLTFQQTGSVYEARDAVEGSVGVLLSYTIFKNY